MIQSYNTLVNTLTQFATNHLTLQRFKCSFFEQMPNFSTADNNFPILYAIPSDVSMAENIDEFSFRIYCVDILQKDRSNEATILNETLLVLRDLNNWLRLETSHDLNILNNPRAIPVNNFLMDFTTGWYMDVTIESTPETSDCAIPFSDNFIFSGVTVDCTQVSPYLTCDTLALCQSFIDLEDRVDNLETIVFRTNELISGGAAFLSGLTYDVTPLEYLINGQFYTTAAATQVTANSGDTNFDRIDLIIVDSSSVVSILEGTPSENPVQPDIDETTQIVIALITVPAGVTAIPIEETLVYDENVGLPTEWSGSTLNDGTGTIDLEYTGITKNGTKSIRFNVSPNTAYAQFDSGTNFDTSTQNTIQFWIYNTVAWTSAQRLSIRLRNAANATVGVVVQLYNGRYGFTSTASSIGVWQLISIPIADFNLSSPIISRIDFQAWVSSGVGFSAIIDVVKFVEGSSTASQANKWWFVRGNTATTIIPTTTNSTLRLAGGSNINTYASGTNFINFDLSTTLTGLTTVNATIFSGGTFYGDGSNLTGITTGPILWTGGSGTNSILSVNQNNTASGNNSLVGGGQNNTINAGSDNSSIIGGIDNNLTALYSSIITGYNNIVNNNYSSSIGGTNNIISSTKSAIIGGEYNTLSGGSKSIILGGSYNNVFGGESSIIGGTLNTISINGSSAFIGGGQGNNVSGQLSAVIGGNGGLVSGSRSVIIGGQNISGTTDDTVYVPYLNVGSISATTTATTYNQLVINTNGDVMTNNLFYIGVNFTVTGVTWDYVALNSFSIYSIDNPSAIGYDLIHNGTAYTLNNVIALYDDLQITGVTATGVLKLNATI